MGKVMEKVKQMIKEKLDREKELKAIEQQAMFEEEKRQAKKRGKEKAKEKYKKQKPQSFGINESMFGSFRPEMIIGGIDDERRGKRKGKTNRQDSEESGGRFIY